MSYIKFYNLSQEPFSNAPVTEFYYDSTQHSEAVLRLRHVVDNMKGLALLVGNIGAGKTTLARKMLDSLPEDQFEAALLVIIHSGISAVWLIKRIALQLGVEKPADEKLPLLSQLYRRLLQIHQQGRKAVVLIDEAQMLDSREIMEEFRGLLNLEIPGKKLISFVFFGLPEIEENLKLDPPLLQRVAMKYRLKSFDLESTQHYIVHRLKLAGAKQVIFTEEAVKVIHQHSKGIPRVINTICDNALFEGFILKRPQIDAEIIQTIAGGLSLVIDEPPAPASPKETTQPGPVAAATLDDAIEVSLNTPLPKDSDNQPVDTDEIDIQIELDDDLEESKPEPVFERSKEETKEDHADLDAILEGLVEKA